ncbi:MAG TPA: AraC family transcriptional regulator [candidate division Zixibacteria bacterium]|nr:AraC family transcriptional regulator [candidate division Zixibacteria bacterium]
MPKPKLLLYSQDLLSCPHYDVVFNHEFDILATHREEKFLETVRTEEPDVVVLCSCSSAQRDAESLARLASVAGPLPTLLCTRDYDPSFIGAAARRGIDRFVQCEMAVDDVRSIIFAAIRSARLRPFLQSCCSDETRSTQLVSKLIDEIVHSFPRRLSAVELSQRLGISTRRMQMICRDAFGKTYTQIMRKVWVYHALLMMKSTNLDNAEISFQLGYSEESSLARLFRKELGFSPSEARHRLQSYSPEALVG